MESDKSGFIGLDSEATNLVVTFVFLGSKIPKYLRLNILRFAELWPSLRVLLVVDRPNSVPRQLLAKVEVVEYKRSSETAQALSNLTLNPNFRSGFWIKTLERLMALEVGHARYPKHRLLHIEGDVLLFPGFPFRELEKHGELSWLRLTEDEDIAALVTSKSAVETSWLVNKIIQVALEDKETSDMRALRRVAKDFPERISYLPSSPEDPLAGSMGVFDALPLGLWLFGVDPKNLAGRRANHHRDESHLQSFSGWDVQISASGGFELSDGHRNLRVNSLHLHSKSLRVLRTRSLGEFPEIQGAERISWSPIAFASWCRELFREIFSTAGIKALLRRLAQ